MRVLVGVVLFLFIVGLTSAALGLKTIHECESDPKIDRDSLRIKCYHSAAMTSAYIGDIPQAKATCESIWRDFGMLVDKDGSDLGKVAELESNACYYDIAKIIRDPEICDLISQRYDFDAKLFGDRVTRENCINEVCRLSQIVPQNYFGTTVTTTPPGMCPPPVASDNICNMIIFILPLFLLGVWKFSRNS
ncbi:Uncharacterised protein [Candidatus Bilamarchaeum dharawalense]|uniref:Uncharacterized protein n=1 Tax=Candidatus Bilamarchaeum dharawalense TaxID=2885759 RepID=A0A5E4LTY5_9ARCH|nr:Uncharacterised protein [Candidatus Bilamarchaeum dharawalense]